MRKRCLIARGAVATVAALRVIERRVTRREGGTTEEGRDVRMDEERGRIVERGTEVFENLSHHSLEGSKGGQVGNQ